ncbi:hypothetical protein SFRURICE_010188 [Spodoptera frugiperda]|nr:hypothetical protein SFRURICE_010188 [Spodoptera frugiperda]
MNMIGGSQTHPQRRSISHTFLLTVSLVAWSQVRLLDNEHRVRFSGRVKYHRDFFSKIFENFSAVTWSLKLCPVYGNSPPVTWDIWVP